MKKWILLLIFCMSSIFSNKLTIRNDLNCLIEVFDNNPKIGKILAMAFSSTRDVCFVYKKIFFLRLYFANTGESTCFKVKAKGKSTEEIKLSFLISNFLMYGFTLEQINE